MSNNLQVAVYNTEEGTVTVFVPTVQALNESSMEDLLSATGVTENYIVMSSADLPNADLDFRDAWEIESGSVVVSLEKAKEITKQRLRIEREPLLEAQDIAYMRALEQGADTTDIVAEKERLRGITDLADSATTLAELRAISV
jgi:hypothetical protein